MATEGGYALGFTEEQRREFDPVHREREASRRLISCLWKLVTLRTLQYRTRCQGSVRDTELEGEVMGALAAVDAAEVVMKEFGYAGPDWPAEVARKSGR
jgi:hypothetical protein